MNRSRGMSWVCFVALVGILCGITAASSSDSIYSGFLGCRFSRTVCQNDEECIDDRLFGNCQKWYKEKDDYQYYLDQGQLESLEWEIRRLVESGYTWDSVYTQCVLANVLLAYRRGMGYDPEFCDNGGVSSDPETNALTEDTLRLLEKYFEDYYDDLVSARGGEADPGDLDLDFLDSEEDAPFFPPETPDKKDEYVDIHKYQKAHKRDPIPNDFLSEDPTQVELSSDLEALGPSREDLDYLALLKSLNPSELTLLKEYLYDYLMEDLKDVDFSDFEDFSEIGEPSQPQPQPDADGYAWWDDPVSEEVEGARPAMLDTDMDEPGDVVGDIVEPAPLPAEGQALNEDMSFTSMTPDDAKTLGELLDGERDVSSLTDEQISRLSGYVNGMLGILDRVDSAEQGEDEEQQALNEDEVKRAGAPANRKEETYAETLQSTHPLAHFQVEVPDSKRAEDLEALPKDPHDHHFDDTMRPVPTEAKYGVVDANYCYLQVAPKTDDQAEGEYIVYQLEQLMGLGGDTFTEISVHNGQIDFRVPKGMNASVVATEAMAQSDNLKNKTGYEVKAAGVGHDESVIPISDNGPKYFVLTFVLCGVIAGTVLAVIAIYIVRRYTRSKEKLAQLSSTSGDGQEATKDYQDLCRQRMQSKTSEKPEPIHVASRVGSVSASEAAVRSPSSRSSTSSWSEEPVVSNMDISTGHIVLSYMEDHLKNKDRLDQEWEALCAYEAEPNSTAVGSESSNMRKNRYSDVLPYDHSRVVLSTSTNVSGSDYVNATTITDHDPRNPAYICTQGPLPHTVADFWQMVWEQGSVVIVHLTRLTENGVAMCHRYWPEEGSDLYHIYEVHLVSEHIWCDDYLVRSFYLKNLQTNETRTVTQFHFLTWPDLGVPSSAKALLDFRRKVNKSYRGRSCPIVVHCSDGVGRTGTYCLIDMVLNRMSKGAKEIDIAASLEHIRDQRMLMVKTKEQFEFALAAVAEEVHAILKALPQ